MSVSHLTPAILEQTSEEASRLALIVSRISNAVILTDPDTRIVWVNEGFSRMTGYSLNDVKGRKPGDFLQGPETDPETVRYICERTAQGQSYKVELANYTKTGKLYWIELEAQPLHDDTGGVTQYLEIQTDITERVCSRRDLEQERDFALALMNTMGQGLTVVNRDWKFEYVNPAYARMTGYKASDLIGKSPTAFAVPDSEQKATLPRRPGEPTSYETRVRRADGQDLHLLVTSVPRVINHEVAGTISVITDITERKQTERDITAAKDTAEQANRAKNEFLARMSHELRTPLNAVLGFAQLLELDELSSEQMQSVQHILKAGKHLLTLINEVLDVSRIEAGTLLLSLERVEVVTLLDEAVRMIQPMADAYDVTVEFEAPRFEPYVVADKQRLKQVILNLLSNGVKYNRLGGRVTVRCKSVSDDRISVDVRDTGIGIPAEKMSRLFMPFDRLGAEESEVEGSGIGLTLSKHLVEAMHGHLSLESEHGRGTTVSVDLPRSQPSVQPRQPHAKVFDKPRTL
jgi:two-component system, sensor histidine kinase and response regulator